MKTWVILLSHCVMMRKEFQDTKLQSEVLNAQYIQEILIEEINI